MQELRHRATNDRRTAHAGRQGRTIVKGQAQMVHHPMVHHPVDQWAGGTTIRGFEARLAGMEACIAFVQARLTSSQESLAEGKAGASHSSSQDPEQGNSKGAGSSTKGPELVSNEEDADGAGSMDGLNERVEAMEQHVAQLSEQLQSQVFFCMLFAYVRPNKNHNFGGKNFPGWSWSLFGDLRPRE
eukprot:1157586-Pelagomonas_calceolata.AAC.9